MLRSKTFAVSAPPMLDPKLPTRATLRSRRTHSRKRSLSLDSGPTRSIHQGSAERRLANADNSPEDLSIWKADLDGVIGAIGLPASPNATRKEQFEGSHSTPTTPLLSQGESAPLSIITAQEIKSVEDAVLSRAESPLAALFRSVDTTISSTSSSDYIEEDEELQNLRANSSPIIRVVVPAGQNLSDVRPKINSGSSSKRGSLVGDLPVLATIEESHSRENSSADPVLTIRPSKSINQLPIESSNSLLNDLFLSQDLSPSPRSKTPDSTGSYFLSSATSMPSSDSPESSSSPQDQAKQFARLCWEEDESFLDRKKIAEWLGSTLVLQTSSYRSHRV